MVDRVHLNKRLMGMEWEEALAHFSGVQAALRRYVNVAKVKAYMNTRMYPSRYQIRFSTEKKKVDHYLYMHVVDTQNKYRKADTNPALGIEYGRAGFYLANGRRVEYLPARFPLHRAMGITPFGQALRRNIRGVPGMSASDFRRFL